MNLQPIRLNGPFFQGWLIRTIDHNQNCSIITIFGGFSNDSCNYNTEYYLFTCISHNNVTYHLEAFPKVDDVTIFGSKASSSSMFTSLKPINISCVINNIGSFHFNENECSIDLTIDNISIKSSSKYRIPWKPLNKSKIRTDGPEGWLGYTALLPCHYYVHSVGSLTNYTITNNNINLIKGSGYSHLEGNHGTFFPDGWIWSQCINRFNNASFSIAAGRFEIGFTKSMNFVIYIRNNNTITIYRSTDLDRFDYMIDSKTGYVHIKATSLNTNSYCDIILQSKLPVHVNFGKSIHIPTSLGFKNEPGCIETYTANAIIKQYTMNSTSKSYDMNELAFDNVALEFGANFQNKLLTNYKQPS